jgi:hypothetical protein
MLLHAEPPQQRGTPAKYALIGQRGKGLNTKLAIVRCDGKEPVASGKKGTYSIVHINETNEPYFQAFLCRPRINLLFWNSPDLDENVAL